MKVPRFAAVATVRLAVSAWPANERRVRCARHAMACGTGEAS